MTAEEYRDAGFRYESFLKMSQWQRARNVWISARKAHFKIYAVYVAINVWPLSWWRRPCIDQSQDFHHVFCGPIDVGIGI
jgi:hypothetical protein